MYAIGNSPIGIPEPEKNGAAKARTQADRAANANDEMGRIIEKLRQENRSVTHSGQAKQSNQPDQPTGALQALFAAFHMTQPLAQCPIIHRVVEHHQFL